VKQWKAIVIGVDTSVESARAVAAGWRIAETAGVPCHLVHVITDALAGVAITGPPPTLRTLAARDARLALEHALRDVTPPSLLKKLEIRFGWPPGVLGELASDDSVLVLGGKRHSTVGRWLAGSTVHRVLRDLTEPLLVVGPAGDTPYRILAAVDLSSAAHSVLVEAQRVARLFRSRLEVFHAVEPLRASYAPFGPPSLSAEAMTGDEWTTVSHDTFDRAIWPLVDYPGAEKMLSQGSVADAIRSEVERVRADLLVVGSHGRGWTERLLMGSTIHSLLADIPTSLLIVPCQKPVTVPSVASTTPAWLWA
jgi:nucleotide-binding universal stress UspA family protein